MAEWWVFPSVGQLVAALAEWKVAHLVDWMELMMVVMLAAY